MKVSMISGAFFGVLQFATRFNMTYSTSEGLGSYNKIASAGMILSTLSLFIRFTNDSAAQISLGFGLKQIKIMLTWCLTKSSATWDRENLYASRSIILLEKQMIQRRLACLRCNQCWVEFVFEFEVIDQSMFCVIIVCSTIVFKSLFYYFLYD